MITRAMLVPMIALTSGFLYAAAVDEFTKSGGDDRVISGVSDVAQSPMWIPDRLDQLWECPDDHVMVDMYDNELKYSFAACIPFIRATPRKQ